MPVPTLPALKSMTYVAHCNCVGLSVEFRLAAETPNGSGASVQPITGLQVYRRQRSEMVSSCRQCTYASLCDFCALQVFSVSGGSVAIYLSNGTELLVPDNALAGAAHQLNCHFSVLFSSTCLVRGFAYWSVLGNAHFG